MNPKRTDSAPNLAEDFRSQRVRATHRERMRSRGPRAGSRGSWQALTLAVAAAAALGLGIRSLVEVDPERIGSAGLIEALPASYFFALVLSLAAFVASLGLRRHFPALLGLQVLVLIVILHAADPIIHGLPRLEASYRHMGIADYIAQSGQLDPKVDAYFNWPGFFALLAMLSQSTGLHDLTGLATWAPLGVNVLLLLPLLALATRLTSQWRHAWTGVWVFYLASWVGQDYMSPQAYTFVLMVTFVACLLTGFSGWAWPVAAYRLTAGWGRLINWLDPTSARPRGIRLPRGDATVLGVVCAVFAMAMTASHQLTPFAVFSIFAAFLVSGRVRLRFLAMLAAVLPTLWLAVVAEPYWTGHLTQLFGSIGAVGATAASAFTNRLAGSDPHIVVVGARLAESALVIGLAVAGILVARRSRLPWLTAALGAGAPLLLFLVQPYGGELLLRLYLFGLPFAACLVAVPLMPKTQRPLGWLRSSALLLLGAVLATTTLITRYGNDKMENFTPDEVQVVSQLYKAAPTGSILIEALHNTPWRSQQYDGYVYETLLPAKAQPDAARLTCDTVNRLAKKAGAYLIVTQSQKDAAEMLGVGPSGSIDKFMNTCSPSAGWSVVYKNTGGTVFHIKGGVDNAK